MSKSKDKEKEAFMSDDEDLSFGDMGDGDADQLLEELSGDVGKPKKRSILLSKDPADFMGDEENFAVQREIERQEKEREQLQQQQQQEKISTPNDSVSAFGVLTKLTPSELEDHYLQCIQLCNQNKVSVKNAFRLQLIDYMKLTFATKSKKTDNLALMGCTLDASAKIYSYRVDKVYADMMKVMSGKVFKEADMEEAEGGAEDEPNDDEEFEETPKKKRKKVHEDDEGLDLEKMLCREDDLQKHQNEGDGLLKERITLPPHLEYFLECPLGDPYGLLCLNGPIFDPEEEENHAGVIKYENRPDVSDWKGLDVCEWLPSYKDLHKCFFVLDESNETMIVDKQLVFDPSLREMAEPYHAAIDEDDERDPIEPIIDYDDGFDDEPALPSLSIVHDSINSTKNRTDFSVKGMSSMISASDNDFSFFDNSRLNFWAGPSHWSIKPKNKKRLTANAPEATTQKGAQKKNFNADFSEFDGEKIKKIFSESTIGLTKRTLKTWSKDKNRVMKLAYSRKQFLSLFHDQNLLFVNKKFSAHGIFDAAKSKLLDIDEHLTPEKFACREDDQEVNMLNDHHADQDDFDDDRPVDFSPGEPDPDSNALELLPAPPKVNKININFSKTQKRIDIKLLKKTIWDFMDLEPSSSKENIPVLDNTPQNGKKTSSKTVQFSEIVNSLPDLLPPDESSQLSVGVTFMAVLHMANEHALCLKGQRDFDDFKISLG